MTGWRRNIPTCVGKTFPRTMRIASLRDGTSPHAWGKPAAVERKGFAGRNIPTCVGKTAELVELLHRLLPEGRNIPTCVGKTEFFARSSQGPSEHPHMRGENLSRIESPRHRNGTSPHAWGKLQVDGRVFRHRRNIPTCVGKTAPANASSHGTAEHPHMRGENRSREDSPAFAHGTSPHAWGKRGIQHRHTPIIRNIPTCVGKTLGWWVWHNTDAEHPHMRGENNHRTHRLCYCHGTSPHAWGKRLRSKGVHIY